MKFELSHENLHFVIHVEKNQQEKYCITIDSSLLKDKDFINVMTHSFDNLTFSPKESELMEDIEDWLEDKEVIELIMDHWDLELSDSSRPPWAI